MPSISPAVLVGPALDKAVLEAIEVINDLGKLNMWIAADTQPTQDARVMQALMDALKINLYWYEHYNGVDQSVVEADCTLTGPIREPGELDAVAADAMTAVYRAVVIFVFGNKIELDDDALSKSGPLGTGIQDGSGDIGQPASAVRLDWTPWGEDVLKFQGRKVLIKFENGHIEDATIESADDGGPYYILFDGEALTLEPVGVSPMPVEGWQRWGRKHEDGEKVLIMFPSGHVEDAVIQAYDDGTCDAYTLYEDSTYPEAPETFLRFVE